MTECVICERPVDGVAYGCQTCANRARTNLATTADLAVAARAVAAGLTRRGPSVGGGGGGRLPINLAATDRLDKAQNAITTWARHVSAERGQPIPVGRDPLATAADWLAGHVEWLRHRREVDEAYGDISAAARVITGLIDGPGDRRWLGQCGATTDDGEPCRTDLHARDGAATAKCRTCGASVDVARRRAELGQLVRGYAYTASEIAAAYPHVKATRIRKWAERGRIASCGDYDGRPVYDLGEVLERAARETARRVALLAKRADQEKRDAEEAMSGAA